MAPMRPSIAPAGSSAATAAYIMQLKLEVMAKPASWVWAGSSRVIDWATGALPSAPSTLQTIAR